MTTTNDATRVMVLTKKDNLRAEIASILEDQPDFTLLNGDLTESDVIASIAAKSPDLILLDYEFQQKAFYDFVDQIATTYTSSAVVVILPENEMNNSDRIILSGARAFLLDPFRPENFLRTIRRVMELMNRNQARPPQVDQGAGVERPKNTFTVFSPKGGAGSTTMAVNLAINLHKELQEDVLLIDGKHIFGHVALYLNLRTANSITDLITHVGMLDPRLVKQIVVKHVSGISVLPSPNSISEGQGIRPEEIFKMLKVLQTIYPNIVIDGGSHLNENTVTYMDLSDNILLVLNPDLASLRDVRQFVEVTQTLSYPPDKTLLVLNLTGRKADIKKEEIESILNMKLFGKIPADENLALSCINEGVPIVLKNASHPISAAFSTITKDLVKVMQKAKAGYLEASKKKNAEVLASTSKLG